MDSNHFNQSPARMPIHPIRTIPREFEAVAESMNRSIRNRIIWELHIWGVTQVQPEDVDRIIRNRIVFGGDGGIGRVNRVGPEDLTHIYEQIRGRDASTSPNLNELELHIARVVDRANRELEPRDTDWIYQHIREGVGNGLGNWVTRSLNLPSNRAFRINFSLIGPAVEDENPLEYIDQYQEEEDNEEEEDLDVRDEDVNEEADFDHWGNPLF